MATYNVSTVQQLISTIITANGTMVADTIRLAPGIYDLSAHTGTRAGNANFVTPGTPLDYSGLPVLKRTLTIEGTTTDPGAHVITRSGAELFRLMLIDSGAIITLKNLTLTQGKARDTAVSGGGVYNKGTLTMNNCIVGPNNAAGYGGGIRNDNRTTLDGCQIVRNVNSAGGQGAGIYNEGINLTVRNSTISENDGANGAGIMTWKSTAETFIENCVIAGNTGVVGAGVACYAGFTQVTGSALTANGSDGAALYTRYSGRMKANNNSIYLNEPNGNTVVKNDNASDTADVKSNYWGRATGPAAGEVSGLVDTAAYQTTPPVLSINTYLTLIRLYGITIYADGLSADDTDFAKKRAWTAAELSEVLTGVQLMAQAFYRLRGGSQSAAGRFANVMVNSGSGSFKVLRAENGYVVAAGSSCNGTTNLACTDIYNAVITFYGSVPVTQHLVVHEFGHRFRNQSALLVPGQTIMSLYDYLNQDFRLVYSRWFSTAQNSSI